MEIEKQCVSRELAEKLKKLNFPQDSYFAYTRGEYFGTWDEISEYGENHIVEAHYSAFTVAELGEMLPKIKLINGRECSLRIWANDTGEYWYCGYGRNGIMEINGSHGKGKTLAEAMSKILIYLAEQHLIDPKTIEI